LNETPLSYLKPKSKNISEFGEKIKIQTNLIFSAEVIDIILDESHPSYTSDKDIGLIKFRTKDGPSGIAYPKNSYLFVPPLKHETVFIVSAASDITNVSPGKVTYYYLDVVSTWNILNFNPNPYSDSSKNTKSKSEEYHSFGGNLKKDDNIDFGEYFEKKPYIPMLKPFEGDVILQSRWGGYFRLGSTNKNKNNWSKEGDNGVPIIILSLNGKEKEKIEVKEENINEDTSSIYLCEKQKIDLNPASEKLDSFDKTNNKPESVSKYSSKSQIILNSNRLVFNSKEDGIFLLSKKFISLSSEKSLNFDSEKVSINSDNLYIDNNSMSLESQNDIKLKTKSFLIDSNILKFGSNNAKEPVILGTKLIEFLSRLLAGLQTLTVTCSTPLSPSSPPINLAVFVNLLSDLQQLISSKNFVE
jgi:hypothetical protein